jgi:prolyl 4-hydroxylase
MKNEILSEVDDFLSPEECAELIELINQNHKRSTVVSYDKPKETTDFRTSSTSHLDKNNELVSRIHSRIAKYLRLPIKKGEQLQGQLYEAGQYFKPHHDYFHDGVSYNSYCLASGNRTHTFMIYLNEDMEGGETDFPHMGKKFKPKTGKAITWLNMENGAKVTETLHEGCPVTSGKKYVITSWWRQNEYNPKEDSERYKTLTEKKDVYARNNGENYWHIKQLPKCSENGFKIIKCPSEVWNIVLDAYEKTKPLKKEEVFEGKNRIIMGEGVTSEILPIWEIPDVTGKIHHLLKPLHEEFCGRELIPTYIYGIRSYLNGSSLGVHTDRIETHHIASTLVIDKSLNGTQDWPLTIFDHKNIPQKVYAEVGDLIIYESALLNHGRTEQFEGEYFRNMFIHYKFKD